MLKITNLHKTFNAGTINAKKALDGLSLTINEGEIGFLSQRLYDTLTGIQWGDLPDEFGWVQKVCD